MYVDFFDCPFPQVLPESMAQYAGFAPAQVSLSPGQMQASGMGCAGKTDCGCGCGMGDYMTPFPFPIPQYLAPGGRGLAAYDSGMNFRVPQMLGGAGRGVSGLTMDGTGLFGTGLFSGGMDFSTWGAGEYIVSFIAGWGLMRVFQDTNRGTKRIAGGIRKSRARSKSKARLKKELAEA